MRTARWFLVPCFIAAGVLACRSANAALFAPLAAGGTHVLFIGNSLTYAHDLPTTVSQVALLGGDTVRTGAVAKPDYALVDHLADGEAARILARERWNVVVMQQGSSALDESRVVLYAGVDQLAPLIRAAGAVPAMYEVWPTSARRFDVSAVRTSYLTAAQRVNGRFFPAGSAWQEAWALDPSLTFYEADGLHPTATATFLAALVIVEQLTGRDVRTLPATAYADGRPFALPTATIRILQQAAHAANARGMTP